MTTFTRQIVNYNCKCISHSRIIEEISEYPLCANHYNLIPILYNKGNISRKLAIIIANFIECSIENYISAVLPSVTAKHTEDGRIEIESSIPFAIKYPILYFNSCVDSVNSCVIEHEYLDINVLQRCQGCGLLSRIEIYRINQ